MNRFDTLSRSFESLRMRFSEGLQGIIGRKPKDVDDILSKNQKKKPTTTEIEQASKESREAFNDDVILKFCHHVSGSNMPENAELKRKLVEVLRQIDRFDFVETNNREQLAGNYGRGWTAYQDIAIEILSLTKIHPAQRKNYPSVLFEQTCSQPSLVLFMLYLLDIKKGDSLLEIGGGCAYAATIASEIAGDEGKVTSIEYFKEIHEVGIRNLERIYGKDFQNRIEFIQGDGSCGYEPNAPYDAIFLSAAASVSSSLEPFALQLKEGGRLILPCNKSIELWEKRNGKLESIWYAEGFGFVPLRGKNGENFKII